MKSKGQKKSRPRRPGRGALMLIAGFFLASGLLRLGDGTGSAIAREVEALKDATLSEEPALEADTCESAEGLGDLLAALERREARIADQEAAIADRMQVLAVAELEIKRNLAELIDAEAALSDTMALADGAAENDLARLTSVYETMKPKDAAALFEAMDEQFSAGFLGRMRPDAAAAIMAGLSPEKAYSISVILAGRNVSVPTE